MRSKALIAYSVLITAVWFIAMPRMPQDPGFHNFADKSFWLGIPQFGDVISNLGFLLAGIWGLWVCRRKKNALASKIPDFDLYAYEMFFAGVTLTAFGSAYYHWEPSNDRLVWDRIPITVSFLSFTMAVLAERVSRDWARRLFYPVLFLGVGSVLHWYWTERSGMGDLRFYALVQILPLTALPFVLWAFPGRYSKSSYLLGAMVFYLFAKVAERGDWTVAQWTSGVVSGHSLKHWLAAGGPLLVAWMLSRTAPRA